MDLSSRYRSSFTAKALSALDQAAAGSGSGRAIDTLDVLLALTVSDAAAIWNRIWLEFGELNQSAAGRHADPRPEAGDVWNGKPVTGTCSMAVHAARALADEYDMTPVPPGVLALCMVSEPATAASHALGATSPHAHARLLELVQEDLIGSSWPDVTSVLRSCFDAVEIISDPEIQGFIGDMADQYQALMDALDSFIRAETPAESGALLDEHPALLSQRIDKLLARFIAERQEVRDTVSVQRLEERRAFLASYRALSGDTLPPDTPVRRYAECPGPEHRMAHSVVAEPGYTSIAYRCERCHVGFLTDLRTADDGSYIAACYVFPADGCDEISREIIMWAVATWNESLSATEREGYPVRRETPVIGWRPDSLRAHTTFIPDFDS